MHLAYHIVRRSTFERGDRVILSSVAFWTGAAFVCAAIVVWSTFWDTLSVLLLLAQVISSVLASAATGMALYLASGARGNMPTLFTPYTVEQYLLFLTTVCVAVGAALLATASSNFRSSGHGIAASLFVLLYLVMLILSGIVEAAFVISRLQ